MKNPVEIIDIDLENILNKVICSFNEATGLKALVVDTKGKPFFKNQNDEDCDFCKIIKSTEKGKKKCQDSYRRAGKQALQYGECYIFRCHAGLVGFAAPIIVKGSFVGSIICGQVLIWEPEEYFIEEILEMTNDLNLDSQKLIAAINKLEINCGRKVKAAADLLFLIINHLIKSEAVVLKQRRDSAFKQIQIFKEIQLRKKLQVKNAEVNKIFPFNWLKYERQFYEIFNLNDFEAANRAIDRLINEIYMQYLDNIEYIKTLLIELIIYLSKFIGEGNEYKDEIIKIKSNFLKAVMATNNLNTLKEITLDYGMNIVMLKGKIKGYSNILKKAVDYINKNYFKDINLIDIANNIPISQFYLSHLFREQFNCTVKEYVNWIRIQEAKKLLRETDEKLEFIAKKVGFKDQSYFSKVFKKIEGVSPLKYRNG
ncbi:PocR ligand-binding domain-containing protein [Carboxydothermus ferrireducens]|uniref:Two-component system response regulator YesN n=1 Tax=Carboxydothermus ferrireducens DSM 11255 TaxID=1119529 RepID=A0ABX2RC63_9THEO|nr:PocR ligand-binding domain-containing protein [Carboxydothermus ferrireducens]NYE58520.1 two-component system response regulator YesN [Carboxydothermus ferrireducens DSM 11255]